MGEEFSTNTKEQVKGLNEKVARHLYPNLDGFKTGPNVLWPVVTDDVYIWSSIN